MGENDHGHGAGSIILAFFIGGIVGAGVALLTAPTSGRETRRKIQEFAGDAQEKAEHYIDEVKGRTSSIIEKGKEFIDEKKSVISRAVETGREAYKKEKEKLYHE